MTIAGIALILGLFAVAHLIDRASEARKPRNSTQELYFGLLKNPWWNAGLRITKDGRPK